MPNWQNIICGTATVLANVLPLVLAGTEEKRLTAGTSAYHSGNVMWYLAANSEIGAYNVGDTEIALNYSKSFTDENGANETLNVYQPLPPRTGYFASNDLQMFKDGDISIAPTVPESTSGATVDLRTMVSMIAPLALGVAWLIGGGFTAQIGKRQANGSTVYFVSVAPLRLINVFGIKGTVTNKDGNTTSGTGVLSTQRAGSWEVPFPPGTNLEPAAQRLSLQFDVDNQSYMQLTAERRRLLFTKHPYEHRL